MSTDFIPVNEPLLNGNEKKYLNECIDTGWISSEGPFVKKFEDTFAKKVNRKYGVAVANGTAAIDIAIEALSISKGDEIIVPTFTIISCINQILRIGAKPVFVDSDPITWNMDVSQIEEKISLKTKAIMMVHIYGLPVDIDPIIELAEKYNLKIIEDAAEMIGQEYKGKPCGSFGELSTFSFYPNKHITTGEGGMLVTNDKQLAEKCRSLRNLCFQNENRFIHENLGWNYRMTNLQAALGLAQLEQLDNFIIRKRKMGHLYDNYFNSINCIQIPKTKTKYANNIYWVYGIVLKNECSMNAKEVMQQLSQYGIGTRPFFYPMHLQPVLNKLGLLKKESYPVSENLYLNGFYLPSGLSLTENKINFISETLYKILS
ncbi:DegT/DnrJ/EryC1/StrS family aminotransferase [Candidatus Woesearchaeota archaeon]|jgi:perosamine synthetase|nr:DegT/DnrJ/EryC1/StrS family aminotransferase [Candidatus Woesearchaeota archaeon]